ncbi:MAG: hypothetical protein C0475_07225 [Planctomyces sp.]|nr:hypothetical protein [Planctomyces sp.]
MVGAGCAGTPSDGPDAGPQRAEPTPPAEALPGLAQTAPQRGRLSPDDFLPPSTRARRQRATSADPLVPLGLAPGPAAPPPRAAPPPPAAAAADTLRTADPAARAIDRGDDLPEVVGVPGGPAASPRPEAVPITRPIEVERLVGQINGKPVFAQQFVDDNNLDARLAAEGAAARSVSQWVQTAGQIIGPSLGLELRDQLILAEARATLTPEQRTGLLSFLTDIRGQIAASALGSTELADARLRETQSSLDELAQSELSEALVQNFINTTIRPRINVTFRDVERAYRADFDRFNPPPSVVFYIIYTRDEPEARQRIERALAAGTPFQDVARDRANIFADETDGQRFTLPEDRAQLAVSAIPSINQAAQALGPGQTSPMVRVPTPDGDRLAWVHLARVEREPGTTLEEAQRLLFQTLTAARRQQEEARLLRRILREGSRTSETEMIEQLLRFAADRYAPDQIRQPDGAVTLPALAPPPR